MGIESVKEESGKSELQSENPSLNEFRLPDMPAKKVEESKASESKATESRTGESKAAESKTEVSLGKSGAEVQQYLQTKILEWLERRASQAGTSAVDAAASSSSSSSAASSSSSSSEKNGLLAMRDGVKRELDRGEFGEQSKKLYRDFANFVNGEMTDSLKRTAIQAVKLNVEFRAGAPFDASFDESKNIVSNEELLRRLASGQLPTRLQLNPDILPELDAMQAHIDALEWKARQDVDNTARSLDNWSDFLGKRIKEGNGKYPLSWQLKEGEDKLAWCLSVEKAMNLRDDVASRIDFWNYAKKMGYHGAPEAPEGVGVHKNAAGDIIRIDVPMPDSAHLKEPQAEALLKRYEAWLSAPEQGLSKSAELLKLIHANPFDAIMQGYTPIPAGEVGGKRISPMGVFSKEGQFQYLADSENPAAKLQPGQSLKAISVVKHNTEVRKLSDGNIQFVLSKHAMEKVSSLGRDWMASPVGAPKLIVSPEMSPSSPVFVSNGSELQAIRADQVESWVESRKASDMFWETTSTALDLGMIAMGGTQLIALKGGRLALSALMAEAGGAVTARTILSGVDRAAKVGVGSMWALDNSKARQSKFVESALISKSAYIGFDASKSLFLLARGSSSSALAFNQGIKEQLAKTAFLSQVDRVAELSFRVSEVPMTMSIVNDGARQIHNLQEPQEKFNGRMAMGALGDGRGAIRAKSGDFDVSKPEVLDAAQKKLSHFENLIIARAKDSERESVKKCFEQLNGILSGKITGAEKDKLIIAWSASFAITDPYRLSKLEERNNGPLSQREMDLIFDQESSSWLGLKKSVREVVQDKFSKRSENLISAQAIALLYASRDQDGRVPYVLQKFEVEVPAYRISKELKVKRGEEIVSVYLPDWQAPRNALQIVDSKRVIRQIEGIFEKSQSNQERIAFGDLLLQTGRLTHGQYAQVLLKVLNDPRASREDKLMSLVDASGPRISMLFDGLALQEASDDGSAKNLAGKVMDSFGGKSSDIEKALKAVARNDAAPDVKSMAAAILYGCQRSLVEPEEGRALLRQVSDLWMRSKDGPEGTFAKNMDLQSILERDLHAGASLKSLQSASFLLEDGLLSSTVPQKEIAQSIVASLSGTDSAISDGAVYLLARNSLSALLNAPEQQQLVKYLQANLQKPDDTESGELRAIKLMSVIPEIYKAIDAPLQRDLEELVRRILTEHQTFGLQKNLRLASLDALSQSQMKENMQAEIAQLASLSKYPEIRQNAYSILEKMNSPELTNLIKHRLPKEGDPAIAAKMADKEQVEKLRTMTELEVEKLWSAYVNSLDKAISSSPNYPILANFNWNQETKFLAEEVFLLDHASFKEEAAKNAGNSWWFVDRLIGNPDKLEQASVQSMLEQREQHWQRLLELSLGADQQKALKARYLLYQIASSNGMPVSRAAAEDYVETGRQRIPFNNPRSLWEERAMTGLMESLKPGTADRDFSLHLLRMSLSESNPWSSPALRRRQFELWKNELGKSISQKEYLLIVAAAARAERQKRVRDYALESELDAQLASYPGLQAWSRASNPKPFFWINRRGV